MGFFKSMDISSTGLAAQRVRMNILSGNLANAQSTKGGPDGGVYRRKDVVFEAIPSGTPFDSLLDPISQSSLAEVKVRDIHQDNSPPRRVHDPAHPDADELGYVSLPNIQVMTEMVNMIAASRAYEANTTALNNAKQMALKALEIGR
jgi:flagellar basal-body rod protein FlgC